MGSPVDLLDEDLVTVPGQAFALVSFVSPDGPQKSAQCGLKIRGCFATRDEANAHVKKLQRVDPAFDVYLVDMYRWLLIPPDVDKIEDQEYQEDFLNGLIKGYKESQLLAKQHFEERKRAIIEEGLDKHLRDDERMPRPGESPGDEGPSGSGTA